MPNSINIIKIKNGTIIRVPNPSNMPILNNIDLGEDVWCNLTSIDNIQINNELANQGPER